MVPFINAVLSYLLNMAVICLCAAAGLFVGIRLSKSKSAKKELEATASGQEHS